MRRHNFMHAETEAAVQVSQGLPHDVQGAGGLGPVQEEVSVKLTLQSDLPSSTLLTVYLPVMTLFQVKVTAHL